MSAAFTQQREILMPLVTAFQARSPISSDQEKLVRAFYGRWFPLLNGTAGPQDQGTASDATALALLSVREWAASQPGEPAVWQIAVGTVIDVAVLWFANDPGAVATNRPEGKALRAFLQSIQSVDFAQTSVTTIAADLMVAVLDTVSKQSGLIVGGPREQALVAATTTAMAGAIKKIAAATLSSLNTQQTEQLSIIVRTVAASTLRAGADTVLNNPKLFYVDTADGPQTKVVEQVGKAFIDLALPVQAGGQEKLDVTTVISPGGLQTLIRATLAAVGNNPGILKFDGDIERRLSPLIADLATSFSKAALPTTVQSAFAEATAIVVGATDRHIDTLWPNNSTDPAQNLARGAVVAALDALAGTGSGGNGFSALATKDVVTITQAVVGAVGSNPALMNLKTGSADPYLKIALVAMLNSLKQQNLAIFPPDDVVTLLGTGLQAAILQLPLLQGERAQPILLSGLIDAVFAALSDVRQNGSDEAKWRATGTTFALNVCQTVLNTIGALPRTSPIGMEKLEGLQAALTQFVKESEPLTNLPAIVAQAIA